MGKHLIEQATAGAVIKPLEWSEVHQRRSDEDPATEVVGWEAQTSFKTFYVIDVGAADMRLDYDYVTIDIYETERAAKAAAQADYERRIRSVLVEPVNPEREALLAELVGALTEALTLGSLAFELDDCRRDEADGIDAEMKRIYAKGEDALERAKTAEG